MFHVPEPTVSRIATSIGRLLSGAPQQSPSSSHSELARYRAIMERIQIFMLQHAIEPSPAAYALLYRYLVDSEPNLDATIEDLKIAGRPTVSSDRFNGEDGSDGLAEITEKVQANLKAVEGLVRRSGQDAKGFGDALAGNARQLEETPHPAIAELLGLTTQMIARTRAAEGELRTRSQAMVDLQARLSDARAKADTDLLTGLSNRRAFERALGAAAERARISGSSVSLAFCDVDHFKLINDTHGHDAGDRVLKFIGTVLQTNCGKRGKVARHGGEEFVVLFEDMTEAQAYELTDAARRDLESRNIIDSDSGREIGHVSFSAGVSELADEDTLSLLLRKADRALYRAKAAGRNQVFAAGDLSGASV
jgi:diguanylate cyclase